MNDFFKFYVDSEVGELQLGPFRVHWYNHGPEEDDVAFFLLGWDDYNIEFGQVDQDRPGIYLTRYNYNYSVEQLRTFVSL